MAKDKGQRPVHNIVQVAIQYNNNNNNNNNIDTGTEVPVSMLLEETDGYKMGQKNEERVKRTHSLFIDDLKTYQEN